MKKSSLKEEGSDKKRGKRKVKLMENRDEFKSLAEAGALPPSEESDEGRVEREVDVMSEPPEIDTTRAEERPRPIYRIGLLCCCCLPIVAVTMIVLFSGLLYLSQHSRCSVPLVLQRLNEMNNTNIRVEVGLMYEECVA
jgi:hypothetical protein